jgi:hypothetical protein
MLSAECPPTERDMVVRKPTDVCAGSDDNCGSKQVVWFATLPILSPLSFWIPATRIVTVFILLSPFSSWVPFALIVAGETCFFNRDEVKVCVQVRVTQRCAFGGGRGQAAVWRRRKLLASKLKACKRVSRKCKRTR